MSLQIYIDGTFHAKEDAKVSVFDHGLLYGDGVFEGIRCYQRNIFRMKEHMDRIYDSAKAILLEIPMTPEELAEATAETIRRNGFDDCYVRLVVTRGIGDLGINPYLCKKASVIIIASTIALYPKELYETGLNIITASTRRVPADSFSPRIKSLNYLNNILAKMEAVHGGCAEAIMLDHSGFIVECTADNFFVVKNGELFTPPTYQGALRGVTRDTVLDIAKEMGIHTREERLTLYEAYTADEVFLTGTGAELIPVIAIDKRKIGPGTPGPMFAKLLTRFREIVTKQGMKI